MYQYIFSHISAVVCTCTNGHMCIIWMLHSWVHASRLRIFMLTRQKQQLHVHRLFQLMGTCRKKYLIFLQIIIGMYMYCYRTFRIRL